MKRIYALLLINLIAFYLVRGNVKMPRIFSDNMVFQRGMRVPVWGWADPGESVRVEIGGHIGQTVADRDEKWKVYLSPLDAGGPFQLIITGKNIVKIQNVLVGEVWVCSGQSNMAMEVQESGNAKQEISSADYPQIRQFQVKRTKSLKPLDDVSPVENTKVNGLNKWEICDSATVGHFTAVGYYFGQFEPQVFPELREAQCMALSLPRTAMVVTIDLGDSASIHPLNKQEVGRRLCLAASNNVYGEDIICSGPAFKSMYIDGNKCSLTFLNAAEGLIPKGGGILKGFIIAGADKVFYEAKAIIEGNKVIVWNDIVTHPVTVRYAWANFPRGCNLYNQQENRYFLPASPFRTDDWPGITSNRK